jgi:hypothetical protein
VKSAEEIINILAEVARHLAAAPGSPRLDDAHYPPAPPGARPTASTPLPSAEAYWL